MPSLALSTLAAKLETILADAPGLEGVHVTQDFDTVTADNCPAIVVSVGSVRWEEKYIVACNPSVASAVVYPSFGLRCIQFSAQSIQDARSQRDTLLDSVIAVLRVNRQLDALVKDLRITSIEPGGPPEGGSMYSDATIYLEAELFV